MGAGWIVKDLFNPLPPLALEGAGLIFPSVTSSNDAFGFSQQGTVGLMTFRDKETPIKILEKVWQTLKRAESRIMRIY